MMDTARQEIGHSLDFLIGAIRPDGEDRFRHGGFVLCSGICSVLVIGNLLHGDLPYPQTRPSPRREDTRIRLTADKESLYAYRYRYDGLGNDSSARPAPSTTHHGPLGLCFPLFQ